MSTFATHRLAGLADAIAPDGSEVRILAKLAGGSMAHFRLPPGAVSRPVVHKTVEELWYFVGGRGRMWRDDGEREEIVEAVPGVSVSIPVGTRFQFRAEGDKPLEAVAVTMPPWPGMEEAEPAEGIWPATALP
jgi:mannose-6-phosphate isomerase-like protein (cupin superfamily)